MSTKRGDKFEREDEAASYHPSYHPQYPPPQYPPPYGLPYPPPYPGYPPYPPPPKKDSSKLVIIIVVVILIIVVVIPLVLAGILYVWVSGLDDTDVEEVEVIPLMAKEAEPDVDDVMFYLKHTGGAPLDLDDYALLAGPEGSECDVSYYSDVRNMPGRYASTWDNQTHTISVNQRVYLSPGCLGNDVDNGDRITLVLINKESERVVWENEITVYDA